MNDMRILRDLLILHFPDQRMKELIEVYGPVLAEIRKLRELDLSEIHPAVLFDPMAPYESRRSDD